MARDDDGDTPLHIAALEGSLPTGCTLIEDFKCDPNIKGFKGRTPLRHAAQKGHIKIIRKFVFHYGCDINIVDDCGEAFWPCIIKFAHMIGMDKTPQMRTRNRKTIFCGSPISGRVLVLESPGAGKSTLVDALTSDSMKLSDVPPHIAGIIPHPFEEKEYGRVIFNDFVLCLKDQG